MNLTTEQRAACARISAAIGLLEKHPERGSNTHTLRVAKSQLLYVADITEAQFDQWSKEVKDAVKQK